MMETTKTVLDPDIFAAVPLKRRVEIRMQSADQFIETHASGTLRKNKRLGMAWRAQYLIERTAYEFGWEFECQERSRVTFGDSYTEGDCHSITEAGWHIERYVEHSIFPEDRFETKYIQVEYKNGKRREGIGIIVRQTSADFFPDGYLVFAIVAEWDPVKSAWLPARNPF